VDEMILDQWKNSACLGYVISALENLGYKPERIIEVVFELNELFDWLSVDNAEKLYSDSLYSLYSNSLYFDSLYEEWLTADSVEPYGDTLYDDWLSDDDADELYIESPDFD